MDERCRACAGDSGPENRWGALSGFWEQAQSGSWPIGLGEHFSLNHVKIEIERERCQAGGGWSAAHAEGRTAGLAPERFATPIVQKKLKKKWNAESGNVRT